MWDFTKNLKTHHHLDSILFVYFVHYHIFVCKYVLTPQQFLSVILTKEEKTGDKLQSYLDTKLIFITFDSKRQQTKKRTKCFICVFVWIQFKIKAAHNANMRSFYVSQCATVKSFYLWRMEEKKKESQTGSKRNFKRHTKMKKFAFALSFSQPLSMNFIKTCSFLGTVLSWTHLFGLDSFLGTHLLKTNIG